MACLLLLLGLIRWALGVPHVVVGASDSGDGGLVDWLVAIGTIGTAVIAVVALGFNAVTNRRDVEERRRHQISRFVLRTEREPRNLNAGSKHMGVPDRTWGHSPEAVFEVSGGSRTYDRPAVLYELILVNASDSFFHHPVVKGQYGRQTATAEPSALAPHSEVLVRLVFAVLNEGSPTFDVFSEVTDSQGVRWRRGFGALAKEVKR